MNNNTFHQRRKKLATLFAITLALYHVLTAYFGTPGLWLHRGIHMMGMLALVFLFTGWLPRERGYIKGVTPVFNCVALPVLCALAWHIAKDPSATQLRQGSPSAMDVFTCAALILLILVAARRLLGIALTCIGGAMVAYMLFGQYIPGTLGHAPFSYRVIVTNLFNTMRGLFGAPVGVASTYIIMFVIFGAILNGSGGGDFFSELASAISGKSIGGPAKTAVIASGFMGMINGSPVANVASTGAFTIPLMKKNGYSAEFAGAVEAAASVGGMILPPVMGSSVFLMSEITETPYIEICLRALLPAVMYFLIVFLNVHCEAINRGLVPDGDAHHRPISQILKGGIHYMVSLAILVISMVRGFSPVRCAFYAMISMVVLSWLNKETRMGPKKVIQCFGDGAKSCMVVSTACMVAGIVVATVSVTGLGLKLVALVTEISGGSLFIALVMTAIASMILGMGVNAVASYIIIAILLAPVLHKMGIPLFMAHFFCYFFSMTAGLTPPVATVSFTAAGISGGSQSKTALTGLQLGITGFVIPFAFVYNDGLLMYGSVPHIAFAVVTVFAGVVMMTFGFRNWMFGAFRRWERALSFGIGLLLIWPETITSCVGLAAAGAFFLSRWLHHRNNRAGMLSA